MLLLLPPGNFINQQFAEKKTFLPSIIEREWLASKVLFWFSTTQFSSWNSLDIKRLTYQISPTSCPNILDMWDQMAELRKSSNDVTFYLQPQDAPSVIFIKLQFLRHRPLIVWLFVLIQHILLRDHEVIFDYHARRD